MAAKSKKPANEVDAFLANLTHPNLDAIRAIRALVLATDPSVTEELKWNAPSFRTSVHFATFHLRAKEGVVLVLHVGAKKRDLRDAQGLADPSGLLEWRAPDRATITLRDAGDVAAKSEPLAALLRAWVARVG